MAYNNYFPQYQPQFQQPMVNYNQFQAAYQQQQQQPTIQNSGFVSVRSEVEARNYPVAPGNSVTFIDENAPYCYTKTMGFSQLDRPRFEKFRLVKEEESGQIQTNAEQKEGTYALKVELEEAKTSLMAEIEKIRMILSGFSKEVKNDEQSID